MYQIKLSDGTILYDTDHPDDYTTTEPHGTFEIGQAGSLQFTLLPTHPSYDDVQNISSYVSAIRDGTEIFYGRVIDVNVNEISGEKQIECAGALQFLEDGELPPTGTSKNPATLTATEFFQRCITAYNSDIGNDPNRALSVGIISHSRASASRAYQITNYTNVKNALESYLINEYGGFLRIRKSGNIRYVDWIEDFGVVNDSPIELATNIITQENATTSQDFYTMIRPVGKEGLLLPEITIALSSELVNEYGRIIKTVTFSDYDTAESLRNAANAYIAKIGKGLGKTCSVNVVDIHFLDNSVPAIMLGGVYTNIHGFEGEEMMVSGMELNFAHPENDSVTLKNAKELDPTSGSPSGRGSLSKSTGKGGTKKQFENIWEHITETENKLMLNAQQIEIHAGILETTGEEISTLSTEAFGAISHAEQEIDGLRGRLDYVQGTAVFQDSTHIAQVAGAYRIRYYIVPREKIANKNPDGTWSVKPDKNPHSAGYYIANNMFEWTQAAADAHEVVYASINDAIAGNYINVPIIGTRYTHMERTSDQTVDPNVLSDDASVNKRYYTKTLETIDGATVTLDDDGQKITVGELTSMTESIQAISGSALWVQRDHITGVVGNFAITTDPVTGEQTLIIVSGGGMKILEDGVEYGVYKEGDLTAGFLVETLSDGIHKTTIKGDYIDIEAISEEVGSRIHIDPEAIRAEVYNSLSSFKSEILVSISGIESLVVSKPMVFVQWFQPNSTPEHKLTDGDMWVKTKNIRSWKDALNVGARWGDLEQDVDWGSMRGSKVYVYEQGTWRLQMDETVLATAVDVQHNEDHWRATAQNVKMVEGQLQANVAELKVEADRIKASVEEKIEGVGSSVVQTAREIRSEVHASQSQLYTAIEQTATNIHAYVRNEIDDLGSDFEMTASLIRTYVYAAESNLWSSIEQTATYIKYVVEDEIDGLSSEIRQTKSSISLVVDSATGKVTPAKIIAAINDNKSSVVIGADHIDLDGLVRANFITSDLLKAKIAGIASLDTKGIVNSGSITTSSIAAETFYFKNPFGSGFLYQNIKDVFLASLSLTQSGNTYTLTSTNGNGTETEIGTFSRATTLALAWSSSDHAVKATASPQGNTKYYNVGVRFASNPPGTGETESHYVIQAIHSESGSTTNLSGTDVEYKLALSGTNVRITNKSGSRISNTPQLAIPLQEKTVTAPGTVTPDSGYVGLSSVSVDYKKYTAVSLAWDSENRRVKATSTPTGLSANYNVGVRFASNPPSSGETESHYVIQAIHSESGSTTNLSGTDVEYKLALSGTNVQVTNASGTKISNTPVLAVPLQTKSITANGTYTPTAPSIGFSSVTVNVPGQSIGSIEIGNVAVSQSQPTGYGGAVKLDTIRNNLFNNQYTYVWFKVTVKDSNGNVIGTPKPYYMATAP